MTASPNWIVAGFAAILLVSACPTSSMAQPKLSIDRLVEYFEIVVFGAERETPKSPFIRKWKSGSTLTYKIGGNTQSVKTFRAVIEKHAKALAFDTGLKFLEIGQNDSGEHFTIWFSEPNEMIKAGLMVEKNVRTVRRAAFNANCYFLTYSLQTGAYIKSMIVINRANTFTDVDHCLLEEMTQSLGLPNDNQLVSPSIFNDTEKHLELTHVDRILLRTLYDERLPAGTPQKAAMELVKGIVADLGKRSGWTR